MNRAARLALLAGVAVIALAIVEIAARRLHPEAVSAVRLARLARDRNGLRTPDEEFHHVGEGVFHLDFPPAGAGLLPRILVVGDSFAMGHGVGVEHRFGTLLGERLRGVADVDVLAATSYSPIVYRNIVRRALAANRYACVAVFVDQTDPSDDAIYRKDLKGPDAHEFDVATMRDRVAVVGAAYDRMEAELTSLPRRLAVVNVLFPPQTLLDALPPESPYRPYVELSLARARLTQIFDEEPETSLGRTLTAGLLLHLDETVALAHSAGAEVVLAANPWEDQVSAAPRVARASSGPYPRENRLERVLVERYGGAPGVVVLELTAAFRAAPEPSRLFLDVPAYEVHWNREGHELVERTLQEVVEHGVLGRSPAPKAVLAAER